MSDRMTSCSPRILSIKWGKMEVEGLGKGKDFKLWPGGGRGWDWQETGTGHSPGIQKADCEELVVKGCTHVVLSRGVFSRLKITEEAMRYLKEMGVEVVAGDTRKAVKAYNTLVDQGAGVGGLFHTTC